MISDARPLDCLRNTWHAMIGRCTNPNNPSYRSYGGRGICVCERWADVIKVCVEGHKYKQYQGLVFFADDMFSTWFNRATIDRIDNDANYSPDNCQWVTRSVNTKKENDAKLANGTHHLTKGFIQAESNRIRVQNGTHNFLDGRPLIGKVNVWDNVLKRGIRITKEEYMTEKNVRYFAPNSKIARRYRNVNI